MTAVNHDEVLVERWTPQGRIPLSGVSDDASWHRARTKHADEAVVLFVVSGEYALDVADAARRAALVEDPRLFPVRDVVVLKTADGQDVTVVEYPMPTAPSLSSVFRRAPLRAETARAIAGAITTGMEAGRRRGVRHRRLDSNRVFVDVTTGDVSILGMGVEAAADPLPTADSATIAYEDVVAIVALLYKALTGLTPGRGEGGVTPLASEVSPRDVPADLDRLCDAVLNGASDDGVPQTTRELLESLGPFQSIPVTLEAFDAYDHARAEEERQRREHAELERADSETAATAGPTSEEVATPTTDIPAATAPAAATPAVASPAVASPADAAPASVTDTPSIEHGEHSASVSGEEAASGASKTAATTVPEAGSHDDRTSREAQQLVDDLHLNEPRSGSAFPGAMSIEPSVTALEESADTSASAPEAPAPERARTREDRTDASQSNPAGEPLTQEHGEPLTQEHSTSPLDAESPHPRPASSFPGAAHGGSARWGDALDTPEPLTTPEPRDGAPSSSASRTTLGAAASGVAPSVSAPTPAVPPSPSSASEEGAPAAGSDRAAPPEADRSAPEAHDTRPESVRVRNGRRPVFDDDPEGGPIIVPGRTRSFTEGPEESPAPDRAHLLRDVVSVATASNAGGSYATYGHDRPEERSRQAQWILIGGVLAVIIFLVLAVVIVTSGLRDRGEGPSAPATSSAAAPSETPTEEPTEESAPEETPEPVVEPTLTSPAAFAVGGDPDHPELQELVLDGDPATGWTTQRYATADFGRLRENVGLTVSTQEPADIGRVTLNTPHQDAGTVQLLALDDNGQPTGEPLATAALSGETVLEPAEPLSAANGFALVVTELPPNPDGEGFRVEIDEITASAPAPAKEGEGA